jgi:hypothetical protein
MNSRWVLCLLVLLGVFVGVSLAAQEPVQEAIPNWPAPPLWSSAQAARTPAGPVETRDAQAGRAAVHPESLAAVPTPPLTLIGINPCRIADTRDATKPAGYGPPSLAGGVPRNFTLTGQCGIAGTAQAVSLNITVTNTLGPGFILIFPQGGAQPLVSTLNYVAGQTVANAAVVPLGTGGGITVIAGVSGTDLIIDTNGYYAPQTLVSTLNTLSGDVTLGAGTAITITPSGNTLTIASNGGPGGLLPTGIAGQTLRHSGAAWVANSALTSDGTNVALTGALGLPAAVLVTTGGTRFLHNFGANNTFLGSNAGNFTMTGGGNTASGDFALFSNTTGTNNTANGLAALQINTTGLDNVASGDFALANNTIGIRNTAIGASALALNNGSQNTALGTFALQNNTTGSLNIAIGYNAGNALTTGASNICFGNLGVAGESQTTRIGSTQTRAFIAGVRGVTTAAAAIPVLIDTNGQLGTVSSSARFKEEIKDMGGASSGLLKLRPVMFRYKGQAEARTQFGLIAEEVEEVLPELVVHNSAGEVETVLYHEMPAMLLNELQKQQSRIEWQEGMIVALQARLAALEAAVRVSVEAR